MRGGLLCLGLLMLAASADAAIVRYYTGTGFYVNKQGHVITNAHVVPRCHEITVAGRPAKLIDRNNLLDIAVLKVVPDTLTVAPLRRDTNLQPGEKIILMGYPGDAGDRGISTYRTGKYIAQRPYVLPTADMSGTHKVDSLLIDPIATHGNSGGPVMDAKGRVIGIIRATTTIFQMDSTGARVPGSEQQVDVAIPLSVLEPYLRGLRIYMLFEHGGLTVKNDARMHQEAHKFILPIRCYL